MSSPVPIFGTQNLHDDDGPVIDSLLIETDNPPDIKEATEPIEKSPDKNPPRPDRLLTGTFNVSQGGFISPVMVLPADANRKSIILSVYSTAATPTATDFVLVASENGLASGNNAFNIHHGKDYTLYDYTGAVWAIPGPAITATIELTWVAVTR